MKTKRDRLKVLVIGAGRLGTYVIEKLLSDSDYYVIVHDPYLKDDLKNHLSIHVLDESTSHVDCLIACLKPKDIDALSSLKVTADVCISFLAGTSQDKLQSVYPKLWVLAMPNICLSPIIYVKTTINHPTLYKIQKTLGPAYFVDSEKDMSVITPLSGSGPAILWTFFKGFYEWGVQKGMNPDTCFSMLLDLLQGCHHLLKNSNIPINELIQQVASPGGVSEKILSHLSSKHFETILHEALQIGFDQCESIGRH
jgi:pyrroline-5-carboxylate reductase